MTTSAQDGTNNRSNSNHDVFDVLIVGSGMSGICMGVQLKQTANVHNFVILEKGHHLGGTWRDNTYPGAACDIPSSLYSFSFHTSDWKEAYTSQKDLLAYVQSIADEYKLGPHILYGQRVTYATWNDNTQCWTIQTAANRTFKANHIVTAVGQLHHPKIPSFPGAHVFGGRQVHTAQWGDLKLEDLRGKNVSVIGTGASAIQVIPQVAKVAKHVQVYQKSAHYVLPKFVGSYPKWMRALVRAFPFLNMWYRAFLRFLGEGLMYRALLGNKIVIGLFSSLAWFNIFVSVGDRKMRELLWPTYPFGAQRVLLSNDYYSALVRPNVDMTTNDEIASLTKTGIKTNGQEDEVPTDVIIYATGFITNPFLYKMEIVGRESRRLHEDHWGAQGSHAFLGISTHGFPNFHMLYGPNTNNSFTSALLFIEEQVSYIIRAIEYLRTSGAASLEIRQEVEDDFVIESDKRFEPHVYFRAASSWYLSNGRVVSNWMGSLVEYEERLRAVNWDKDYIIR